MIDQHANSKNVKIGNYEVSGHVISIGQREKEERGNVCILLFILPSIQK